MLKSNNDLVIDLLSNNHDRSNFHCGIDSLDTYLKKQAKQDMKRRISQVFVATQEDKPKNITGYYTLSTLSIELNSLPPALAKKLPRHPVPAALIGRLAVSINKQGNGIGKMLLIDAIKRTLSVSDNIVIYTMVVDAIDYKAEQFYKQFGFIAINEKKSRLFLPLKSFKKNT